MSLRTEIREAVEEAMPPAPMLVAKTEAFVRAHERRRVGAKPYRPRRWTRVLRGSLAMVAVLVLIALVAAVLVGGRLVHDWNTLHSPAPAAPSARDLQIAQLEARPLNLPAMPADGTCPDGPITGYAYYGAGPAYMEAQLNASTTTSWGTYGGATVEVDDSVSGPVLIRARDIRTGQPLEFITNYTYGPAVGTDRVSGATVQRHLQAVLDMDHPPAGANVTGKSAWSLRFGYASGFSGCTGWKVDGEAFSEVFVTGLVAT